MFCPKIPCKRALSLLLVLSLVLGSLSGCGPGVAGQSTPAIKLVHTQAPELTGVLGAGPADGIGTPGVDFKEIPTGPVAGWDDATPAPFFNPLGSRDLYEDARAYGEDGQAFATLDGVTPKSFYIEGWHWRLTIKHEELTRNWLLWKGRELGAVIYETTPDSAVFYVMEGDSVRWWVHAQFAEYSGVTQATIDIYKTFFAPSGKAVTIKPGQMETKGENGRVHMLYTDCVPGKAQSVKVTIKGSDPDCGLRIRAEQFEYKNGVYKQYIRHDLTPHTNDYTPSLKLGDTIIFDDIPIVDGMLKWEFTKGAKDPDEITFTISETADIPAVKWGDQMGMLKIEGPPAAGAQLELPWNNNMTHPDFNGYALKSPFLDPDGNYAFVVPAGYYTLYLADGAASGIHNSAGMQLVPVSSGEITTVTVPAEMAMTYSKMLNNYGNFETDAGSMSIHSATDNGDTATVALLVNDPLERDVFPEPADLKVTENGLDGKVVSIKREPAAVNVVLVLDSSGSMKGNMEAAVAAAKRFVQSLPDSSAISLIQFAQEITEHKGNTKQEVLASLDKVQAVGATAIYDATARALKQLEGKERSYVVIFSDGADSREPGIDGTGSALTREQIVAQIGASKATVLTIGFGEGHDPKALLEMSEASPNGAYFVAANKDSLDSAFAAVSAKFGNQFTVVYERPVAVVDQKSDIPVVSVMMDISGSMNMAPGTGSTSDADVDYRLDRVKGLFHDFILNLPANTLMQFSTFNTPPMNPPNSHYRQMTTDQKAPVLRAVGSVQANGGTPTLEALQTSLWALEPLPTSKKVLVFFTDAALEVRDDGSGAQKLLFDRTLAQLKEAGVRVLFAGLGNEEYAAQYGDIFRRAAELAGGDYILTSSVDDIARKLQDLLSKLDTPAAAKKGVALTMKLDARTEDGSRMNYAASSQLEEFTMREAKGQTVKPAVASVKTGEKFSQYDRAASQLLYGSDNPSNESRIVMRLPLPDISGANAFAKLTVKEAYFLDTFKGIKAPSRQEFLALNVELAFQKSDSAQKQSQYVIPSIFRHFYVSLNNGRMMPASKATWLAEQPLTVPGREEIALAEKEVKSGVLIFMVDRNEQIDVKQLSLHMYDASFGHIELPLAGAVPSTLLEIAKLPQAAPPNIADAFELSTSGLTDVTSLGGVDLYQHGGENSAKNVTFRVLEAEFASKVQALLDLNTQQRFLYAVETENGVLLTKMSDIVHNLPLGFAGSAYYAPGSVNPVRLPFALPNPLLAAKAYVFGDISGGSFHMPVQSGPVVAAGPQKHVFEHEYFTFTVNALSPVSDGSRRIVLDFTVTDKADGQGTAGFDAALTLQRDTDGSVITEAVSRKGIGNFSSTSDLYAKAGTYTADLRDTRALIFGASDDDSTWGAFDGQSRRGLLIYNLPDANYGDWSLTCGFLPTMKLTVEPSVYTHQELLCQRPVVEIDKTFEQALNAAVHASVQRYEGSRPAPEAISRMALSDDGILAGHTPSPSLTLYGAQMIKAVQTDEDFLNAMCSVRWVPTSGDSHNYLYSPEAVLTQGWGTQQEQLILARALLSSLGYRPTVRTVTLTETGKENLRRISGTGDYYRYDKMYALSYTDAQGAARVFVPVFQRDLSELRGLCALTYEIAGPPQPATGSIRVTARGKLTKAAATAVQADKLGDLGSFLGGAEEPTAAGDIYENVDLLKAEFSLPDIGKDAFDVSLVSVGKSDDGAHDIVTAVADTRFGFLKSPDLWIDTSCYDIESVSIELYNGHKAATHTTLLQKDEKLTDIFFTLAFSTPELSDAAAAAFETAVAREAGAAPNTASYTGAQQPGDSFFARMLKSVGGFFKGLFGMIVSAAETKTAEAAEAGAGAHTAYSVVRWFGHATVARMTKALADNARELSAQLGIVAARTDTAFAMAVTVRSDGTKAQASVDLMNHKTDVKSSDDVAADAYRFMMGAFASEAESESMPGGMGRGYLDVWSSMPKGAGYFVVDSSKDVRGKAAQALRESGFPELLCARIANTDDYDLRTKAFIIPTKPGQLDGQERWAWLELDTESMDVISMFDTGERSAMASFVLGLTPKNAVEVTAGALVGLSVTQFSVAAYSLKFDSPKSIAGSAKLLAVHIHALLKQFMSDINQVNAYAGKLSNLEKELDEIVKDAGGYIEKQVEGEIKGRANSAFKGATGIDVTEIYKKFDGKGKELTFVDGFGAAIDLYFSRVATR